MPLKEDRHIRKELDAKDNFDAFRKAALHGRLDVLRYFAQTTPRQLLGMIAANNFEAFRNAATRGHLDILQFLEQNAAHRLQDMIAAANFAAFRYAAEYNHLNVMQYLEQKVAKTQLQAMFSADSYAACRYAIEFSHLDILQYLEQKKAATLHHMIADGVAAFHHAALNGRLDVMQYIEQIAPQGLYDMLHANGYRAFHHAVINGRLDILQYLEQKAGTFSQAMIIAGNIVALYGAALSDKQELVEYLLRYPEILAFAELHEYEYRLYVNPYITRQLEELHTQKRTAEEREPHAVFDVSVPQARGYFYILRRLIRRNDETVLDEIRFLLSIPAVKNLAHVAVTQGHPNELLCLALNIANAPAVQILLNLPSVRALAARHNYYQDIVHAGLDLRTLAHNRESSMTALSAGEQKCLAAALAHYNPTLQQEGMVPNLITALKELLQERYEEHPAAIAIERNGLVGILKLPMAWEDFIKLTHLSPKETQDALQAYYQHKDHTAWRYLSKPNPWMHPHAAYVYISDDLQARWSTFEEYQPLIALLFLGAMDERIACIDGFSFESRLSLFIEELALIGRAHNWDKTRSMIDDEGNILTEEYDDLEGDRPSCYSGVKRRLFQSVHGHPLFKILTKEIIAKELYDFVRQHLQTTIASNNPEALLAAWNNLVLDGNQEAISTLKVLDITATQQQQFKSYLQTKFGPQFSESVEFKKYVDDKFKLRENDCHAVYFGYVGIEDLLQKAIARSAVTISDKPQIMFHNNATVATAEFKNDHVSDMELS